MDESKPYASVSISYHKTQTKPDGLPPRRAASMGAILPAAGFAEIEIDFHERRNGEAEGRMDPPAGQAQPVRERASDPVRELFFHMRSLASGSPFARNDARLFYKQAQFMEGFEDDYPGCASFSMYYPCYQHMSYEQLRTYFTWRAKARRGEAPQIPLSYLFLYIYELLSGVGADNPADGLRKLMGLWKAYRESEPALDSYLAPWLKDYHVYYATLPPFADFVEEHGLRKFYSELFLLDAGADSSLAFWSGIANYDAMKSKFYQAGNETLFTDCFYAVLRGVRALCASHNARIEDLLYYREYNEIPWYPFQRALFYPWHQQPDRRVEMPGRETYYCKNGRWTVNASIPYAGRREFAGYLIKKTEVYLRKATKYRFKISADPGTIRQSLQILKELGVSLAELDGAIEKAVDAFRRDAARVVVSVDHDHLARIRREALITQDKLTVPGIGPPTPAYAQADRPAAAPIPASGSEAASGDCDTQAMRVGLASSDDNAEAKSGAWVSSSNGEQAVSEQAMLGSLASSNDNAEAKSGAWVSSSNGEQAISEQAVSNGLASGSAVESCGSDGQAGHGRQTSGDHGVQAVRAGLASSGAWAAGGNGAGQPVPDNRGGSPADGWGAFKKALTSTERRALSILLAGGTGMKALADENGVMLEVLADGINEKAADYIGDNVLECGGSITLYDEYKQNIVDMLS